MRLSHVTCCVIQRRVAAVLVMIAACGATGAQPYPSKQLEFVVQTSPGSGTDVFGRGVTDMLLREKLITQSIVVNNRVGGSGAVAYNYIKSKRGDPYTVLCVATGGVLLTDAGSKMPNHSSGKSSSARRGFVLSAGSNAAAAS